MCCEIAHAKTNAMPQNKPGLVIQTVWVFCSTNCERAKTSSHQQMILFSLANLRRVTPGD